MRGFTLLKGVVFEWNGAEYRIERLQSSGAVLLERTEDGQLSLVVGDQLLAEYGQGHISTRATSPRIGTPPIYSRPFDELSPSVQKETTRRKYYLQAILDGGSFVFTRAFMLPVIAGLAEKIGDPNPPSVVTLYRWHARYRAHQDLRALIPRNDRRGQTSLKQDPQILQLGTEALEEAFKASPQATGKNVFVRLVAKIDAENRHRLPTEQLKLPSLRTVYRMLARVETIDQITLKEGKAVADKRLRIGKTGIRTSDILERVEIDHTPLDLFLIDEQTWLPLGRPTLTVAIDHFSRMLLGYYLSFGSPSTAAVVGALRHAILPKEPIGKVLPELTIEHTWPCYGRPDVLVVDNGLEFHGKDLESVSFDLDIRIQYCPKHQPRFKGVVERYLKTINYFFAHQLPGTSFARLHQRGDYDSQKHALLVLAEFKYLFEKWVVDVYAQTVHRGIGTTPWAKWHEGLNRRQPGLPADLRQLQQRIGLVSERALRRDGIWLQGIRYSDESLQPIIGKFGEGVRVRVLFDPEDLGAIQVWGPSDEIPRTVLAIDQTYARGLTARQNEMIRTMMREQGVAAEDRVALQEAKHQLVLAVQALMASRKQRHRRKAAAIVGASSSKPKTELFDDVPQSLNLLPGKDDESDDQKDEMPVPVYRSFQLKN
ncbi:Mu transposase C-terminal domain-containing protein [Collimonas humicola]|uniref:Mu transposase C-terminal domain-containing protein n=1 Tax=Collimonas humicola TaxID=2825886 RepID=UPI001B8CAD54|nr:Mu transposase C-terminal domain-containing protein [Collimonas humicola]